VIVGVISDTHGLVRPQALAVLAGSDRILHAGDVGAPEVLHALAAIAPVVAVRGNNDAGAWARRLPERTVVDAGGVRICIVHELAGLRLDPKAPVAVVVSGHSHRPKAEARDGVLYLNPGSAGPRRFALPVTVARLRIEKRRASAEIVDLLA
jgi:putative phosphoesterase